MAEYVCVSCDQPTNGGLCRHCLSFGQINSAAPELLDALENLVIGIGMGWDLDGIIEAANAAISKARGETTCDGEKTSG